MDGNRGRGSNRGFERSGGSRPDYKYVKTGRDINPAISQGAGQGFIKQAMILAAASMLVRIIGFAYRLPLTRMIGDVGNNYYVKAYNIYNFFLILSSSGMPSAISKLVSERVSLGRRDEAHRVFKTALAVSGLFGFVCMILLFAGSGWFSVLNQSPRSYYSLIALAPTVFIVAIMAVVRGYFQGLGTTVPTSASQVVEQVFNAVFSVVLASAFMGMAADDPIAMGAAGGTAGTGVGALFGLGAVMFFYFRERGHINRDVTNSARMNYGKARKSYKSLVFEILGTAIPIITGMAVFSITNLIDSSMVTWRLTAGGATLEQAEALFGQLGGKYSTIITLPISVSAVFAMASMPSISSSNVLADKRSVEHKINMALRLTMLICVPAAAGLGVLGQPIMELLYGDFQEGGILLNFGAVNIIFMALNQILTGPLQATGNIKVPIVAAAAGSVVKIVTNFFLVSIPQVNIIGAIVGTLLCYITASAINWHMLKNRTGVKLNLRAVLLKPVFCSALMGAIGYIIYNLFQIFEVSNTIRVLAAIGVSVIAYLILMLASGGIGEDDMRMLPLGKKLTVILRKAGLLS